MVYSKIDFRGPKTALTIKKIRKKNLLFFREMRDNRITTKTISSQAPERKEVFTKKTKEKVTRAEAREHLAQFHLSCELLKVIRRFFPDLLSLLKQIRDPRDQRYITYQSQVLLMTRILSSIFYISSMRKTSEEFNCSKAIENIGYLCGQELKELPYWETINDYLKRVRPEELQETVCRLVKRLVRSRAFERARIRGKHWQIIIDGTQLYSSREKPDGKCLHRVHNRGTEKEYTEYYYYVLEAKIMLHPKIYVSIMTEFAESQEEAEKQDCELKASYRLIRRLREGFPMLPVCICGDSLYACDNFFRECREAGCSYLLRFKEGSIPGIYGEYQKIRRLECNYQEERHLVPGKDGGKGKGRKKRKEKTIWYDYVTGIAYEGHSVNFIENGESGEGKHTFHFLTDLPVTKRTVKELSEAGKRRWAIENEGFNTQKNHGYNLEHRYSHDYQAWKNHYYLIQIGHMISQVIEAWEKLWEKVRQSREQKHRRLLEAWKQERLKECAAEEGFQIRFEW